MSHRASRTLGVLLALVPWGFSGVFLLGSLFWGLGLRCDESCGDAGDWRRTEDAWQWDVLPLLGGLTFIAGTALVVCVWRARPEALSQHSSSERGWLWQREPGSSPAGESMSTATRRAS